MYACINVRVYIYMYRYTCIHVCIYAQTYIYIHIRVRVSRFVCMHLIHVNMCLYTLKNVNMCKRKNKFGTYK